MSIKKEGDGLVGASTIISIIIILGIVGYAIWKNFDKVETPQDDPTLKPAMVIRFAPSPSPDVVGYRVFVENSPNEVKFNSKSFYISKNETEFNLKKYVKEKGNFNIGISAVDEVGNLSSMQLANDIEI